MPHTVNQCPTTIDLNCDLGEDPGAIISGRDVALAEQVSSLNIACGGHAGDDATMEAMVDAAVRLGRAIGAHPGYPDRVSFGRIELPMSAAEVRETVSAQVALLARFAEAAGARVAHLKPHGALYHAAMRRPEVAAAIAEAVRPFAPIRLVGLANGAGLDVWESMGFAVLAEAFADRRYGPQGSLLPRTDPRALIEDPAIAAAQALRIARGEGVVAADGSRLAIAAGTICLHSDTPGALAAAMAVRAALLGSGIGCVAPA
jgi:UPF0271 protein